RSSRLRTRCARSGRTCRRYRTSQTRFPSQWKEPRSPTPSSSRAPCTLSATRTGNSCARDEPRDIQTGDRVKQRTLVLVKPDGVRRKLVGEVVRRLEQKTLDIVAMKMLTIDKDLASEHYAEHVEKPFFGELLEFITSGPVVAMAVEGDDAITVVRQMMGATDPKKAAQGTIRGDYGL